MSDTAVVIEHVTKRYGGVTALNDVSVTVHAGELLALLGPSGCGKTTLLRSVAGLEKTQEGRILIGGRDVTGVPVRERPIGMVFQSYALFPNLTVAENIAFPLQVRGTPKTTIAGRVDDLLMLVNLTAQRDRYPNQISGGQAQRCALARALAPDPKVLLLDEPLSALDALVRTRLRDEIRRIQQSVQITALYVTHDQSEALAIADRVAVMNAGIVEQISAPTELYETPETRFSAMFVGSRNAVELPVWNGRVTLGQAFSVPAPAGSNGAAIAFFRPEDVEVTATADGAQPAEVQVRLFLGATMRLHLVTDVGGQTVSLFADLPRRAATAFKEGDQVGFRIESADVRAFAKDA
jgi:putative spermidine/putrescine transport system ATP-binding protein